MCQVTPSHGISSALIETVGTMPPPNLRWPSGRRLQARHGEVVAEILLDLVQSDLVDERAELG